MELTMTNSFGFCELNEQEMMEVDGGAITTEPCKFIVSSVVGLAVGKGIEKVGAKIGGTVGSFIEGPVGTLAGTLIGAGIGYIVAEAIIE